MDCGSGGDSEARRRIGYYRAAVAVLCVIASLTALGAIGLASVKTLGYTYGYGYGYQYEYQEAHLIVIKHVVNDNGGTASASQFTMTINGVTATGGNSFPGQESPGTNKVVTPGSYSVTETGPSGYSSTFSADCSGTIAAGQTKTCTVTNDDRPGHLIVIKHVINDNGGSATAAQFTMTINGVTAQGGNSFPGQESPGTDKAVSAGNYNVTETGPSGYTKTFSADCTGTIALGQTKTCTVTNNDQHGHIIVIKHVINDDNCKAKASQFSMRINGVAVQGQNPFPGQESPGTNKTVNAGSYTVTETGPSGYNATFSVDCSGTIGPGQTKTCTVTNNDISQPRSIGYWKNHAAETTALLPRNLGNYTVATFAQATAVFNNTNCASSTPNGAVGCLAGQLLGTKLNLARGTNSCIQPTVNKADNFLKGLVVTASGITTAGIVYTGPSGTYTLTAKQRAVAIILKTALDKYNNGDGCFNP
jgi:prealbumin domain-containing protein